MRSGHSRGRPLVARASGRQLKQSLTGLGACEVTKRWRQRERVCGDAVWISPGPAFAASPSIIASPCRRARSAHGRDMQDGALRLELVGPARDTEGRVRAHSALVYFAIADYGRDRRHVPRDIGDGRVLQQSVQRCCKLAHSVRITLEKLAFPVEEGMRSIERPDIDDMRDERRRFGPPCVQMEPRGLELEGWWQRTVKIEGHGMARRR